MSRALIILSVTALFFLPKVTASAETREVLWCSTCLVTNVTPLTPGCQIYNLAPDGDGGCYLFGTLRGSARINGAALPNSTEDLPRFLARLNSSGDVVWFKRLGAGPMRSRLLARNGGVILSGVFIGATELDGKIIHTGDSGKLLIAEFNSLGNCVRRREADLSADQLLGMDALELDKKGDLIIAGWFAHTLSTAAGSIKAQSQLADIFLSRCDTNGTVLSKIAIHGNGRKSISQITVDSKNSVLMTGEFEGKLDVAGIRLESRGKSDAFVAKFDEAGTCKWAKRFGGPMIDAGNNIAVDKNDNCYVTGIFGDTADFAGTSMRAKEGNLFISKLTSAGDLVWVRSYGDHGYTSTVNLIITPDETLILSGYHEGGKFQLGGLPLRTRDFIAGFSANGELKCAKELNANSELPDHVLLAQDAKGDLYLTGTLNRLPKTGQNERLVFVVSKIKTNR